jgi:hypothetical protein
MPNEQEQLEAFTSACNSRAKPKRDPYGQPHLRGRYGVIYSSGDEFIILCGVEPDRELTPREWTFIRKVLRFADLTQDGDCEGVFLLHRLPDKREGTALRKVLGLPKRREISDEERQRLRALALKYPIRRIDGHSALDAVDAALAA